MVHCRPLSSIFLKCFPCVFSRSLLYHVTSNILVSLHFPSLRCENKWELEKSRASAEHVGQMSEIFTSALNVNYVTYFRFPEIVGRKTGRTDWREVMWAGRRDSGCGGGTGGGENRRWVSGNSGYSIGIGDKLLEWGLKNCEHCEDSEHRWSGWEGRVSKHAAASYSTSSSALLTCLVKTGITTYICGLRKRALKMLVQCEQS